MDWGVGVLVFIKTQQSLLSWDNDGVGCGCVPKDIGKNKSIYHIIKTQQSLLSWDGLGCGCISVYKNTTKLAELGWIGVWVY